MNYVIRVTFDGRDVYLRHGATSDGAIVRFKTLREARERLEQIKPGLDDGDVAAVVEWRKEIR